MRKGNALVEKVNGLSLGLLVTQVALVPLSWLVSAMMPQSPVRSLLSGEGVRWLFGRYVDNLLSPLLVWLLLLSMGYGAWRKCGFGNANLRELSYRERLGIRLVLAELVLCIGGLVLLTSVPHAALLSVTGSLFPSSFSAGLVPVVALMQCLCSLTYGLASGHMARLGEAFASLPYGVACASPLLVAYVFAAELFDSLRFVFSF